MPKLKVNDIDIEVERNKFDPLVKKQKNIPYLVDQHLLEKENA